MLIRKNEKQADYWKNFFQTVFANLEEVLIAADVDMDRLEYISPNAERLLGIRQEEQRASLGRLFAAPDRSSGKLRLDGIQAQGFRGRRTIPDQRPDWRRAMVQVLLEFFAGISK